MADEQTLQEYRHHPIPQNVLGVEFKLVGDLTLRQFLYVAVSVILAYLSYSSALPAIVSYPLAVTIASLGLAIAFLPVQGLPFDKWFFHFIKALTSPTQMVWRKSTNPPEFFLLEFAPLKLALAPAVKDRARLEEYLRKLRAPTPEENKSELDIYEENFYKRMGITLPKGTPKGLPPAISRPFKSFENRAQHKVTGELNLASEVSYSKSPVISIPTGNNEYKFVSSITNTTVGRKLHAIPGIIPGTLDVAGEISIDLPPEPEYEKTKAPTVSAEERETQLKKQLDEIAKRMAKAKLERPVEKPKSYTGYVPGKPGELFKVKPTAGQPNLATKVGEAPPPPPSPLIMQAELEKLRRENFELQKKLFEKKPELTEREKLEEIDQRYRTSISRLEEEHTRLSTEAKKAETAVEELKSKADVTSKRDLTYQKSLKNQEESFLKLAKEKELAEKKLQELQKEVIRLRDIASPNVVRSGMLKEMLEPPIPPKKIRIPAFVKTPNVISGVVTDSLGKLLEGAVVIVKDVRDEPVRALKTNQIGQFATTTPLINGRYTVSASYENHLFDIMTVDLLGTILDPIEVVGTPANA